MRLSREQHAALSPHIFHWAEIEREKLILDTMASVCPGQCCVFGLNLEPDADDAANDLSHLIVESELDLKPG